LLCTERKIRWEKEAGQKETGQKKTGGMMRSTFFLDFLIEIVDVDGLVWWRICLHHFARLLRTTSRLLDGGFEEDGNMDATLLDYR
jgi:hypothetical protein